MCTCSCSSHHSFFCFMLSVTIKPCCCALCSKSSNLAFALFLDYVSSQVYVQVLCIYYSCHTSAMILLSHVAVYLVMETLYKRFSHGKFTYASLPVLHSPKSVQPSSKLDAAMLSQHDIDSRDDSAHEHTDTGQHNHVQQLQHQLSALAITC